MDELDAIFGQGSEEEYYDDEGYDEEGPFGEDEEEFQQVTQKMRNASLKDRVAIDLDDYEYEVLEEKQVADTFVSYISDGVLEFMKKSKSTDEIDFKCPMTTSERYWRSKDNCHPAASLSNSIPVCKGNANGFVDIGSFYQHFQSRGRDCSVHKAISIYLAKKYGQEITHVPKDPFTGRPLLNFDMRKIQKRMHDFKDTFSNTNHGDLSRKIVWPPIVIMQNLEESKFNSKTKILNQLKEYGPEKACALYTRKGRNQSAFRGEVMISFPKSAEGYFFAIRLLHDVSKKGLFKQAKAFMTNIYHIQGDRENYQSYKKILKGWSQQVYREVVFDPSKKILDNQAPSSMSL